VQVGPPMEKERDNIRFSLTGEAGLNDGMAFPFVWLAILLANVLPAGTTGGLGHWFLFDLLYRLGVGIVCGFLIGKLLAWLLFHLPDKESLTQDGFVAISATLIVYGVTEMIQGYG